MSTPHSRIVAIGARRGGSVLRNWAGEGFCAPAAICDLNQSLANERADIFVSSGLPRPRLFESVDQLLDWGQFDAALVATPDRTHHAIARQVMQAGKAVYVEKPMTTTVEDAADLVRVWRQSGKVAAVGHEFRHTQAIVHARKMIAEGRIGTPRLAVTMDYCGRMGSYWRRRAWRDDAKSPDDSLTLQKGIHQLDIQGYLLGQQAARVYTSQGQNHYGGDKPAGLTCEVCDEQDTCRYAAHKVRNNGIPAPSTLIDHLCVYGNDVHLHDNQTVTIDYDGGARGSYVECFFTPDYRNEHQIIGDLGRITVRYFSGNIYLELEVSMIGQAVTEKHLLAGEGAHGGGDVAFGKLFCQAVTTGTPVQPDLADGFHAVALAKAIDQSGQTGQPTTVPALRDR